MNRQKGLKTLESEMQNLQELREDVEGKYVDKVLDKSSKVSQWLEKVKKFDDRDADGKKLGDIIKKSNFVGLIYGKSQHKAGKRIVEKNADLDALKLEGKDYIIADESNVLGHKKGISVDELVGMAERKANVIKKHVAGQEYGTILVYGMAGCGKTAVVSAVNDMLLSEYSGNGGSIEDPPFNKIIWVTVENKGSDQSSIEDLQDKIAAKLSIDLKSSSVSRAETLRSALSGKRFLVILDDMWIKNISLKKIGVPYPSKENGCRVIIVSRSHLAMSSDSKVEIEPLSDQEAQDLFQRKAGMELSILEEEARATAETMIEECEGLPSGIVTLVETLKTLKKGGDNDSDSGAAAWRTAFDELKTSSDDLNAMNEKAFRRLRGGYDMLQKDAQQCFLYCALYPSGHLIEKKELVEYWFCEGLLDGCRRSGEIEDIPRAKEIMKELKRAHLVKTVGEQQIKLSNLAWKMAVHHLTRPDQLLINSGEQNRCSLLLEEDTNVPQVMRASLMMSKIKKIMEEPMFSKLSTLLLQKNPLTQLHKNFFDNMPNLKVLDLSQTKISTIPNLAFSKLKKLRALLVRNCPALKSLPSLADCEELLLLDLSDTPIKQLPDGMEKLTKLIRLNLSRTNVGEFGAGVACALENLGELFMITNVDSAAGFLGGISETGASNIEEWYQPLPNLYILHIKFLDAEAFDRYVVSKTHDLSKFKFCVAGGTVETTSPDNSTVSIQGKFFVTKKPVSLPDKTSELHVSRNSDLPCLPASPLKSLKVINISYCTSLVYLFKRDVVYELPNLETISVEKCPLMKALVESTGDGGEELPLQLHPDLKRLKFINISDCENLVYVFRTEMVEHLSNLKKISISRRQVEKNDESKEPKEGKNLVLVDRLELNTKYEGPGNNNEPEKEIWSLAKVKIEITTSPQGKLSHYLH